MAKPLLSMVQIFTCKANHFNVFFGLASGPQDYPLFSKRYLSYVTVPPRALRRTETVTNSRHFTRSRLSCTMSSLQSVVKVILSFFGHREEGAFE